MANSRGTEPPSPAALMRMDISEVKAVARKELATANRAVKRLRDAGLFSQSPAAQRLGNQAKFSYANMSKERIIVEIVRARNFMSDYTHTIPGTREFVDDLLIMMYGPSNYEKGRQLTTEEWEWIHEFTNDLLDEQGGVFISPSDVIQYLVDNIYYSKEKGMDFIQRTDENPKRKGRISNREKLKRDVRRKFGSRTGTNLYKDVDL